MAITVNTNIGSLTAQKSLNSATNRMNSAMEKMSTGYKINSSKDDAAGMAVSTKLNYQVSALGVAQDNAQMGVSMLDTTEGVLGVINSNLARIRDLTEQAANGTYGSDAIFAINSEITARLKEISRISDAAEFNGKKLINGSTKDVNLQVGITSDTNSIITIEESIFADATATALFSSAAAINYFDTTDPANINFKGFGNLGATDADKDAQAFLEHIDSAISNITNRTTSLGGKQASISSAMDTANIMQTNLTEASSLIQDADIARESSNYIKEQILQQTSATLLSTANQTPNIALNLV